MSIGAILSFLIGVAGPASLLVACVCEFMARRMTAKPRKEPERIQKCQHIADIALVCSWLFLAAAYLCFSYLTPDAAAWQASFEAWMSVMLTALVILDIIYLYLRRARPRSPEKKKRFWEL